MANISEAFGTFTFIFPRSPKAIAKKERLNWLKHFGRQLDKGDYSTFLSLNDKTLEELTLKDMKSVLTCNFNGFGRWNYQNNLEWITQYDNIADLEGLQIDIDYTDYEIGHQFIGQGSACIKITNGKATLISDFNSETLNLESYVRYGVGDKDDYIDYLGLDSKEELDEEDRISYEKLP